MAETRAYLRALAHTYADIGYMLRLTNLFLLSDTGQEQFISIFLARLHQSARSFVYCGAGHDGFLVASDGETIALPASSIPLSVTEDADYPCSSSLDLHSGDLLVLFTDGFPDARAFDNLMFGKERILAIVRANADRPAADIIAAIYTAVSEYTGHRPTVDDMSIVIVKTM